MSLNLNFNRHSPIQSCNYNPRQKRLMLRTPLFQTLNRSSHSLLPLLGRKVHPGLINLFPSLTARFLYGVLDIGEGLLDLFTNVRRDLFGEAVPTSWIFRSDNYDVKRGEIRPQIVTMRKNGGGREKREEQAIDTLPGDLDDVSNADSLAVMGVFSDSFAESWVIKVL